MVQSHNRFIGGNIKILREASGLSQHDFSTLVDISKRSIANIEAGKTSHNLDLLDKILDLFDYKLEDIRRSEIKVPINFRERLIEYHKGNPNNVTLLKKQPNIVFAVKFKLLQSPFIDDPKEINEIKSFFEQLGWVYRGTSISNALKRMPGEIQIRRHQHKGNTNVYSKK
ncbi:MAG: helix-turn-helix domain-containing protein [Daejeonella sp.]